MKNNWFPTSWQTKPLTQGVEYPDRPLLRHTLAKLALLQLFLNHRRFLRNERWERVGKSPAELLTGSAHPHWLEIARFSRN